MSTAVLCVAERMMHFYFYSVSFIEYQAASASTSLCRRCVQGNFLCLTCIARLYL